MSSPHAIFFSSPLVVHWQRSPELAASWACCPCSAKVSLGFLGCDRVGIVDRLRPSPNRGLLARAMAELASSCPCRPCTDTSIFEAWPLTLPHWPCRGLVAGTPPWASLGPRRTHSPMGLVDRTSSRDSWWSPRLRSDRTHIFMASSAVQHNGPFCGLVVRASLLASPWRCCLPPARASLGLRRPRLPMGIVDHTPTSSWLMSPHPRSIRTCRFMALSAVQYHGPP